MLDRKYHSLDHFTVFVAAGSVASLLQATIRRSVLCFLGAICLPIAPYRKFPFPSIEFNLKAHQFFLSVFNKGFLFHQSSYQPYPAAALLFVQLQQASTNYHSTNIEVTA